MNDDPCEYLVVRHAVPSCPDCDAIVELRHLRIAEPDDTPVIECDCGATFLYFDCDYAAISLGGFAYCTEYVPLMNYTEAQTA